MSASEVSAAIVDIQRQARFAGVTPEQWAERLTTLIAAKVAEPVGSVENVRPVGTAAGGSNGTMLFDLEPAQGSDGDARRLVLRFLPTDGLFHRYDVRAQFELQRALAATDVPVPPQLWLDEEGTYLERPGYVMEQVPGEGPPMAWMGSGIIADATPEERSRMAEAFLASLSRIHAVDWRSLGLQWLEERARGSRPIERETNWYWDALVWSGMSEYEAALEPVRAWLVANEPDGVDIVLCHGDANIGNYLYSGQDVSAVVDWEMAFLGTPECDLTFNEIGDLILQPDVERPDGFPSHAEMREAYERLSGRTLQHLEYFELFSAYRIAIINVLAMKHFPEDVLAAFMPVLERGPELCLERAAAVGALPRNT